MLQGLAERTDLLKETESSAKAAEPEKPPQNTVSQKPLRSWRDQDRERAEAENRARDMATINVKLDGISGDVRDIKDERCASSGRTSRA